MEQDSSHNGLCPRMTDENGKEWEWKNCIGFDPAVGFDSTGFFYGQFPMAKQVGPKIRGGGLKKQRGNKYRGLGKRPLYKKQEGWGYAILHKHVIGTPAQYIRHRIQKILESCKQETL